MSKRTLLKENLPTTAQLEQELKRERKRDRSTLDLSFLYIPSTFLMIALVVAALYLPAVRITDDSMSPVLQRGDVVFYNRNFKLKRGGLIAFQYNNKILVKRAIAGPGEWVNIDDDGTVSVNGKVLKEHYLVEKALGDCQLEFPYQVPESKVFVLGDSRKTSIDSRSSSIGCIPKDQIVGEITFCIWPLSKKGAIKN